MGDASGEMESSIAKCGSLSEQAEKDDVSSLMAVWVLDGRGLRVNVVRRGARRVSRRDLRVSRVIGDDVGGLCEMECVATSMVDFEAHERRRDILACEAAVQGFETLR